MKRMAISLAALGMAFGLALAQEQQPQQGGPPPKPKFGPELAKLSFLTGTFTTENMAYDTPLGKGGPGKGRNMNRWGLDSLFVMVNYEGTMAIMCAEAVYWRCHRSMISDFLKSKGVEVAHIFDKKHTHEHGYSQCAKIVEGQLSYHQTADLGKFDSA